MDERLYTYEYRRPRFNNPTQQLSMPLSNSHHVSNSLSFFANQLYRYPELVGGTHRQPYHLQNSPKPAGYVSKSLEPGYSQYHSTGQPHQGPESPQQNKPQMYLEQPQQRARSRLSGVGDSTLRDVGVHLPINEKDIYRKQQKQFNIISLKPKEYEEYIKKYPKLSKEDFQRRYVGSPDPQTQLQLQQFNDQPIAGKPAYGSRQQSSRDTPQPVNAKALKNVDEIYM